MAKKNAQKQTQKRSPVTLISPKGREFVTASKVEVANLRARGYKIKPQSNRTHPNPPAGGGTPASAGSQKP